jgi:hypothetical protein
MEPIVQRIKAKATARMNIGWFDHSEDSHDMRVVKARAFRIFMRLQGQRISMREALWG